MGFPILVRQHFILNQGPDDISNTKQSTKNVHEVNSLRPSDAYMRQ